MSELQPLRNPNVGFRGEKAKYYKELTKNNLSEELESLKHSLEWPVNMGIPNIHITCYFGDLDYSYSRPDDRQLHYALDIQAPPGTVVTSPEDAIVVINISSTPINEQRGLADIILYSPDTKLAYVLAHLDSQTLSQRVADRHWFDRHSDVRVEQGEPLGTVGLFFTQEFLQRQVGRGQSLGLNPGIRIPKGVNLVYGRSYDHLHFSAHHVRENHELSSIFRLPTPVNPIHLLRRLY